jgi:hypothetical protein
MFSRCPRQAHSAGMRYAGMAYLWPLIGSVDKLAHMGGIGPIPADDAGELLHVMTPNAEYRPPC